MAYISAAFAPVRNMPRVFDSILNALVSISEANSRVHQVERYQAMSDEQLSKLGLRREDIVRHVFRDVFYL